MDSVHGIDCDHRRLVHTLWRLLMVKTGQHGGGAWRNCRWHRSHRLLQLSIVLMNLILSHQPMTDSEYCYMPQNISHQPLTAVLPLSANFSVTESKAFQFWSLRLQDLHVLDSRLKTQDFRVY